MAEREEDPALQPLTEAGQGEAEGFEEAERELEENATHGDGRGFPEEDVPDAEEDPGSEFAEADGPVPPDGPEE